MNKDIDKFLENIEYGEVSFTVTRHNNRSTRLAVNLFDSKKYSSAADLAADMLQAIKNAQTEKVSGSLTFTVVMKKGEVKQLIKHDYKQVDYPA